jgi:hypothetical protein
MIGVTLGTSGGDQWQPLFIAVVFHQVNSSPSCYAARGHADTNDVSSHALAAL